jgi:hypothetical protein
VKFCPATISAALFCESSRFFQSLSKLHQEAIMQIEEMIQVFEGTFKPPTLGLQVTPVKVAGTGYCELSPNGFRVQGFKQASQFSSGQVLLLFVVLLLASKFLVGGLLRAVVLGSAFALIYHSSQGKGTDHTNEVISLDIPWQNVISAKLDQASGVLVIHVKALQCGKEFCRKGALFFQPNANSGVLLNALNDRSH